MGASAAGAGGEAVEPGVRRQGWPRRAGAEALGHWHAGCAPRGAWRPCVPCPGSAARPSPRPSSPCGGDASSPCPCGARTASGMLPWLPAARTVASSGGVASGARRTSSRPRRVQAAASAPAARERAARPACRGSRGFPWRLSGSETFTVRQQEGGCANDLAGEQTCVVGGAASARARIYMR